MKKRRFAVQAFLFSIQHLKNERQKLIADSLGKSDDLYEALLETKNAPVRNIKFERYELLALKRNWDNAMVKINNLPETEHFADMKLFVKSYRRYISSISGTILGMDFLDVNLEGLEKLLATDRNWEKNLKKMRIDFMKAQKKIDDKMELLRKAGV